MNKSTVSAMIGFPCIYLVGIRKILFFLQNFYSISNDDSKWTQGLSLFDSVKSVEDKSEIDVDDDRLGELQSIHTHSHNRV